MARVAALVALLASGDAAGARKLAIVDVAAPPMMMGLGSLVTQSVVQQAEKEPGVFVIGPEKVRALVGAGGITALQDCAGRAECVADKAASLGADHVVVGWFDRNPTSYLVRLWLVDVRAKQVVSSVDRAILIASRRLPEDVKAAIPGLLKGQAEALGKLKITSNAKNARVAVDGTWVGIVPYEGEFKPGKHTLNLERKGYLPVERFATVEGGKTEELKVTLIAMPGAEEEDLALAQKQAAEAAAGGLRVPLGTLVSGGAAIAAAGLGLLFGYQMREIERTAVDADGDGILDITRREGVAGQDRALLANVAFVAAGAAVVAGVVFAFTAPDASAEPTATSTAPVIFVSPAGAGVAGRF